MSTPTGPAITRDPETHSGAAVFSGTRIAIRYLLDYLADGQTIDDFLSQYPSVRRVLVVKALEEIQAVLDEPSCRAD